ncbi:ComF family protein [Desulfobotulus sp.]|uniref:ComF family protein n=1 Tax=Desulfobotulus sp. TaxID=1940337 RepID=UPI002A36D273|nr:ComF family protein [Desulfobotulus sp.]MDY0162280.1 ComF family protein [Desulfobotulus sp.]
MMNFFSWLRLCVRGLLPDACRLCRSPLAWPDAEMKGDMLASFFCPYCIKELLLLTSPLCRVCGLPLPSAWDDHVCGSCLESPPAFRMARAPCLYEGKLVDIIHRFKYRGRTELALPLARLMAQSFRQHDFVLPHRVLPVPMTKKRIRQRGFNQAGLLARALMEESGWKKGVGPVLDTRHLIRLHHTQSQTGLGREARKANVKDAFGVTDGFEGEHLLLVDDVFTTGATVGACARVLRAAGALSVSVLTAGHRP